MAIRAVLFDVGGVLETVDDPAGSLEPWRQRLGLTPDELADVLAMVDPDGAVAIGRLSEAEYAERYAAALSLPKGKAPFS